jgi:hypothetical protein
MDTLSIAVSLMSARAQSYAETVAASLLKSDFGSQKAIAQLLTSSNNSLNSAANLASGLGQNLDITA